MAIAALCGVLDRLATITGVTLTDPELRRMLVGHVPGWLALAAAAGGLVAGCLADSAVREWRSLKHTPPAPGEEAGDAARARSAVEHAEAIHRLARGTYQADMAIMAESLEAHARARHAAEAEAERVKGEARADRLAGEAAPIILGGFAAGARAVVEENTALAAEAAGAMEDAFRAVRGGTPERFAALFRGALRGDPEPPRPTHRLVYSAGIIYGCAYGSSRTLLTVATLPMALLDPANHRRDVRAVVSEWARDHFPPEEVDEMIGRYIGTITSVLREDEPS